MMLFCSTMHFASGRVRRKTFQFVLSERRKLDGTETVC